MSYSNIKTGEEFLFLNHPEVHISSENLELNSPNKEKEERNCLGNFQQLGSYCSKIYPWNQEEIPFPSLVVTRGLLVAEVPQTALHDATHLHSNQANPLVEPAVITTGPRRITSAWYKT